MRQHLSAFSLILLLGSAAAADDPQPGKPEDTVAIERQLRTVLERLNKQIEEVPDELGLYSRRGDVHFFLADFERALADYDKMVELNPEVLQLHWRRGLAQYYVGRYDESAKQFERYFEQDKSDRENGIWRFYAQVKKYGLEEARKKLLPYDQPDRAPLPAIYDLCAGKITSDELEAKLTGGDVPPAEAGKREFYGHLYLGLDYAIKDEPAKARPHLEQAVASEWAQTSGYGPNYMWQIARLERDRALAALSAGPFAQ